MKSKINKYGLIFTEMPDGTIQISYNVDGDNYCLYYKNITEFENLTNYKFGNFDVYAFLCNPNIKME